MKQTKVTKDNYELCFSVCVKSNEQNAKTVIKKQNGFSIKTIDLPKETQNGNNWNIKINENKHGYAIESETGREVYF